LSIQKPALFLQFGCAAVFAGIASKARICPDG